MRKEFSVWIEKLGTQRSDLIFFSGDLGFQALENVQKAMGSRFVNAGVSEQNMISMAAALAQQGLTPFCYSIAPFTVFRPAEQIRLDVCIHGHNVKIVGNGGGYGYGIMGPTHHAIEDLAVLSSFHKMKCYIPFCNEEVSNVCESMMNYRGPSYLRLGFGNLPETISLKSNYQGVRKIAEGDQCTIVGIGPVLLNAIRARDLLGTLADIFVVSEFPLLTLDDALKESILKTKKLLVVEEHVKRGGLGENLSIHLLEHEVSGVRFRHRHAQGYADGHYGSQAYHQKLSSLDPDSLMQVLRELLNE